MELVKYNTNNDFELYKVKNPQTIELLNILLPFNIQLYNNNFYLNAEIINIDNSYNDNIKLITDIEEEILKNLKKNLKFVSIIKNRSNSQKHIKLMFDATKDPIYIKKNAYEFEEIKDLPKKHKNKIKYNIKCYPSIVWINSTSCGINWFIQSINIVI